MHLCVVVFAGITFHYIKNVYTKSGAEKKNKKLLQTTLYALLSLGAVPVLNLSLACSGTPPVRILGNS